MQEFLFQTVDAGVSAGVSFKQWMLLFQTDEMQDARDTLLDILSIRQRMQECLYRTADARDTLLDMHPLSDIEVSPASAV